MFQVKVFAGAGHELPHATGPGRGHGLGIECAFNERQQSEFGRHASAFNFFDDVVEVFAGARGHAVDVFRPLCIPLLTVLHQIHLQVRHGKTTANPLPQVCLRIIRFHGSGRRVEKGNGRQIFYRQRSFAASLGESYWPLVDTQHNRQQ